MFYQYNIYDYSDASKPIKSRLARESLLITQFMSIYDLTLHNLELSDDIYSPFKSTANLSYLTMSFAKKLKTFDRSSVLKLQLKNEIVIEKRARYSTWDLLGDVGGFNDGLMLVCHLLTSAFSAASFKTKFLRQVFFDSNSDERRRTSHENRSTISTIMESGCDRLDPSAPSVFQRALKSARQLNKFSFIHFILPWCQRNRRQNKFRSRVIDKLD